MAAGWIAEHADFRNIDGNSAGTDSPKGLFTGWVTVCQRR